jgi:dTDP-4-amino-4,6-dideoxygalactose transaminase
VILKIPRVSFNKPFLAGKEKGFLEAVLESDHLSGNGPYTKLCQSWLEQRVGCKKALLTQSGTTALEMAAILADVGPGDEVIMPSFTFVSTANAFVLRGAVPVFVDIRPDTLNIDEAKIETAITFNTKAIVVVHYAGVSCEMEAILAIAQQYGILVIEDNAHGMLATNSDRPLGSLGHMAALSFHETKNIISGEGGALLVNDDRFVERSEIIWEKGTNRAQFFRGEVDKYTWVDIGSSCLPSELTAAFLYAQMEDADMITGRRLDLWNAYHAGMERFEMENRLQRPRVPENCKHNAHMYYVLLPSLRQQNEFLAAMKVREIGAIFHYVPLHSSPAGKRFGRVSGNMDATNDIAGRIVRLPLWTGMEQEHVQAVLYATAAILSLI